MQRNRTIAGLLASVVAGTMMALTPVASYANDTNNPDHWETQPGEICVKTDGGRDSGGYTVPAELDGRNYSKLILKKGDGNIGVENQVFADPVAGQTYTWQGFDPKQTGGWSHVILCSIPETTPGDACPNMPGDQAPGTSCTPPDACPNMPGDQAPGTSCTPPVAPAPPAAPAPPVSPAPPADTDVLGEASGKALGTLRVTCQGTVRVTLRNRSSERATYTVKIANRKHAIRVGAEKDRRWATTAQARQRVQLWQGGKLLASKRLPRACVAPEVLPDTGV